MSPSRLSERLAQGEPLVLLDVRRPEERAYSAIAVPPSAFDLYIPMDEIPARLPEVKAAAANAHGPLIVYCHHGLRSRMVVDWLADQGLPGALNLDGGIDAWSETVDASVPRY